VTDPFFSMPLTNYNYQPPLIKTSKSIHTHTQQVNEGHSL